MVRMCFEVWFWLKGFLVIIISNYFLFLLASLQLRLSSHRFLNSVSHREKPCSEPSLLSRIAVCVLCAL